MATKIVNAIATPTGLVIVYAEPLEGIAAEVRDQLENFKLMSPEGVLKELKKVDIKNKLKVQYHSDIPAHMITSIESKPFLNAGESFQLIFTLNNVHQDDVKGIVGSRASASIDRETFTGGMDRATTALANAGQRISDAVGNLEQTVAGVQGQVNDVRGSLEEFSSFSLLTSRAQLPDESPGGSEANGGSLGAIAAVAVREVLGWKPNAEDAKGFVGALNQSFELSEFEGRTKATWTPRTYAVQTDMSGGISGAQASLYERARQSVDSARKLLEGLKPLRNDADPEDMESVRSIVQSQMNALLDELGTPGGPRVIRVDRAFDVILGLLGIGGQVETDSDEIKGSLGTLRDEFGVWFVPPLGEKSLANTVEEEQIQTNFRIVSDYMTSLRQSWINDRKFFLKPNGGVKPFFGTQLVLLTRQLTVISESVDEVRSTMDSVFIGRAERQTIELDFDIGNGLEASPMSLEELLTWVQDFASREAPALITDGGKHAVETGFRPIVTTLIQCVEEVLDQITPPDVDPKLPTGMTTKRVRRAWAELEQQLKAALDLTVGIEHAIPAQA